MKKLIGLFIVCTIIGAATVVSVHEVIKSRKIEKKTQRTKSKNYSNKN